MRTDVAILIISYNSEEHIEACLQSVIAERAHITQQIIVLDNNSSDRTVALILERFPEVKLLVPGRNLGFAAGVNAASREADAEFLLLLNPDTVLKDHAVDVIVKFARAFPAHGLYGGRTLKPNGNFDPSSCWGLPSVWSLMMFACGLSTLAKGNRLLDPESLGKWPRNTVREVGMITGCFLLVRRTVWQNLGGFDERFFMYGEDTDLAARAWAAGYRPVICPDARLVHEGGRSSSTPLNKALLLYRGKATYVRSHWRGLRRSVGLWLLLAGVGLRALPDAFHSTKRPPSVWRGVWRARRTWIRGYDTVRNAPAIPTKADHRVALAPQS